MIIHMVKYLKATRTQGITMYPEGNKSFKVYDNADFCVIWHRPTAGDKPSTAKSWTGYTILYTSCPIIWCSKLQKKIVLPTMESEYIAFSKSLHDAIHTGTG